jgi:hypothetical protein
MELMLSKLLLLLLLLDEREAEMISETLHEIVDMSIVGIGVGWIVDSTPAASGITNIRTVHIPNDCDTKGLSSLAPYQSFGLDPLSKALCRTPHHPFTPVHLSLLGCCMVMNEVPEVILRVGVVGGAVVTLTQHGCHLHCRMLSRLVLPAGSILSHPTATAAVLDLMKMWIPAHAREEGGNVVVLAPGVMMSQFVIGLILFHDIGVVFPTQNKPAAGARG